MRHFFEHRRDGRWKSLPCLGGRGRGRRGKGSLLGDGEQFFFRQHDQARRLDAHGTLSLEALELLVDALPRSTEQLRQVFLGELQADAPGPVVAVSDFMKIVPEQVARFLPGRTFVPLGTDGMGRSDTRDSLRGYFEVNTGHVVVAVLSALAADGKASPDEVQAAIARHGIDPGSPDPLLV